VKLLDSAIYSGPRPAGLTGTQELSVTVEINRGTRSGIDSFPIVP